MFDVVTSLAILDSFQLNTVSYNIDKKLILVSWMIDCMLGDLRLIP